MGDGTSGAIGPGRRIERHEQNWQRAKGFLAAVSVLFRSLSGHGDLGSGTCFRFR